MGGQLAGHSGGGNAYAGNVVGIVSVQVLHVVGAGWTLHGSTGTACTIFGIINETDEVKTAFICPEVLIFVSG